MFITTPSHQWHCSCDGYLQNISVFGAIARKDQKHCFILDQVHGTHLPAYSDALRFLLLTAYGGGNIDADVLLMRSFQPLYSRDF
jgi:hypothetical protein